MLFSKNAALLLTASIAACNGQGGFLHEPAVLDSVDGFLDTTVALTYANYEDPCVKLTNTRLMNGKLPGNTIRVNPGDLLNLTYHNSLIDQEGVNEVHNEFQVPDWTNIHFHGGHLTGELPGDDVTIIIKPDEFYEYSTLFPDNHMPGTHWIHPHLHGSSSSQVGGGAAMGLIVADPPGYLPPMIEEAEEHFIMIQEIGLRAMNQVKEEGKDGILQIEDKGCFDQVGTRFPDRWRVVNGQYRPQIRIKQNEWKRLRMVHGGWLNATLDITAPTCDMVLLAKEGVYILDFPRTVEMLPIPAGGGADIMIRCSMAGSHPLLDYENEPFMTMMVTADDAPATEFEPWMPDGFSGYLEDTREREPSPGCDCRTFVNRCEVEDHNGNTIEADCFNDRLFELNTYIHTVKFGTLAERSIGGMRFHPYHQHVYPFQIVAMPEGLNDAYANYYRPGDWGDSIQLAPESPNFGGPASDILIRYNPVVFTGKMMVHCHILIHEDKGTMTMEYIDPKLECTCETFWNKPDDFDEEPEPSEDPEPPTDPTNTMIFGIMQQMLQLMMNMVAFLPNMLDLLGSLFAGN